MKNVFYLIVGILFGITLVRSQVISWYRIQEMFLFDNFHMYGVIGTAIVSAALGIYAINKFNIKTIDRSPVTINGKTLNQGTIYGGVLFGLGWSTIGACPGPLYALIGNGAFVYLIGILGALLGVVVYGFTIGSK